MSDKHKQDAILEAVQNPEMLDVLYDLWTIVKQTPTKAAAILIQFRDVSAAMKVAMADMQDSIARFRQVEASLSNMEEVATRLALWNKQIRDVDEKHVLNRCARIIEMSKQIDDIKASGGLALLDKLLSK